MDPMNLSNSSDKIDNIFLPQDLSNYVLINYAFADI
jgi:hypothetical protein